MRRCIYILTFVLLAVAASAQHIHRVGFGVSAGAGTLLGDSTLTNRWGPLVGIEGYYACLYRVGSSDVWMGPRTGLEFAWLMSGWSQEVSEQFSNKDYLGYTIDYTVSAKAQETHHQLALSIPLMAALRYRGLNVGVGFKLQAMLWDTCRTELTNLNVRAYYPKLDVAFVNDPFFGSLSAEQASVGGSRKMPELHLALSLEAGYEWELSPNRFLGFRVFADYDLWNSFARPSSAPDKAVIIAPIQKASQPAQTSVVPLCQSVLTGFSALRIGVTIAYTFDFPGKTAHSCNCLKY